MKYSVCMLVPYSVEIEADSDEEFREKLEYQIPPSYGGDGIYVECEDGRFWDE